MTETSQRIREEHLLAKPRPLSFHKIAHKGLVTHPGARAHPFPPGLSDEAQPGSRENRQGRPPIHKTLRQETALSPFAWIRGQAIHEHTARIPAGDKHRKNPAKKPSITQSVTHAATARDLPAAQPVFAPPSTNALRSFQTRGTSCACPVCGMTRAPPVSTHRAAALVSPAPYPSSFCRHPYAPLLRHINAISLVHVTTSGSFRPLRFRMPVSP